MNHAEICPLCGNQNSKLTKRLNAEKLVNDWQEEFGFDIRDEFRGIPQIELYQCRTCKLQFFKPDSVAGSPAIYEKLSSTDRYYHPQKWEHDAALRDLDGCTNGIEIGCGFGSFVAQVIEKKKIGFEGCEQNPSAIETARQRNLPIRFATSQTLASRCPGAYTAVCAFQVLEHLIDPHGFLDDCCTLLRPGGKLMIGLPNAESFLKYEYQLLDLPPHHMTRWTADVLRYVENLHPLRVKRIVNEPLADYHVDTYIDVYTGLLSRINLPPRVLRGVRSRLGRAIRGSKIQPRLRGHTIYACYVRV